MPKKERIKKEFSKPQARQWNNFIKPEYLILIAILLLALFIRVNLDPTIPYHYDPGKNIVYTHAALDSFPFIPHYNPYFNLGEYYEYQVLFPYIVAFLHVITGISCISLTAWLAIAGGAALCLTIYCLAREIFHDTTAALISAFLIATSEIQLLAYMNYYPQILAMTLMPLAAVFIIRSVRSPQAGSFLLAAIISCLIVLASYLAAAVFFIIVLVSLGIWCFKDKNALKIFLALPLMTAALLAFFWMPMIWRHGILEFSASTVSILLTPAASPFTNQPFTLMNFVCLSSVALIALVMGIIAVFFIRKISLCFENILLSSWLVITLILMGSYLIHPILWVDRYCQFFDIALCLAAGGIITILIKKLNTAGSGNAAYRGYLLLLLLCIPLYGAATFHVPFGKWGYPSDIAMTEYLQTIPPDSLVVAPPDIQSFWFSAAGNIHTLGGESSQMIGHRYLGEEDSNAIINDPNPDHKMELIRKYGVNYIVLPVHKQKFAMWHPPLDKNGIKAFDNDTYFEAVKISTDEYGSTILLKVRENLTPRYLKDETSGGVIILGYLISMGSLAGFGYIAWRKPKIIGS